MSARQPRRPAEATASKGKLPVHILDESKRVLGNFALCDSCLGRMYLKRLRLTSSRRLGARLKSQIGHRDSKKCYVCKGLAAELGPYVDKLASISSGVHYSSFLVGATMRHSLMDRDDQVRSKFQMRGADSIKAEITRMLTRSFARRSGKTADHTSPDLTFLVDFRTKTCTKHVRHRIVSGSYTKTWRGLPQKQRACEDCGGRGCTFCGGHGMSGFDSVEGVIFKELHRRFSCQQARFTWVGGEDRDSLVLGEGRPFFAKMINPLHGGARLARTIGLEFGISLYRMHRIEKIPRTPTRFRSKVTLHVKTGDRITARTLARLGRLVKEPITVSSTETGGRHPATKRIYEASYKKTSANSFDLMILADGGIPMKKLVAGDGVDPGVSGILGVDCTCITFDFDDILITRGNN